MRRSRPGASAAIGSENKPLNGQAEVTSAGSLVLARLLVAGDKGATGGEVKKTLEPSAVAAVAAGGVHPKEKP